MSTTPTTRESFRLYGGQGITFADRSGDHAYVLAQRAARGAKHGRDQVPAASSDEILRKFGQALLDRVYEESSGRSARILPPRCGPASRMAAGWIKHTLESLLDEQLDAFGVDAAARAGVVTFRAANKRELKKQQLREELASLGAEPLPDKASVTELRKAIAQQSSGNS